MSQIRRMARPNNTNAILTAFTILLLAIIPFLIVISLDNHFRVKLTEDFTTKGHSDSNEFGIIFGDSYDPTVNTIRKEIVIPYNYSSGEINADFVQPKTDNVVCFYDGHTNMTNYTIDVVNGFSYQNTENITAIYNNTDTTVTYLNTPEIPISEALFTLQKGVINGTNEYSNMSFYPPPSLIWENVFYNELWYEYWTPNASYIGKEFTRIYLPFRYVPSTSGRIYVQIYNATTSFCIKTLRSSDIYNPSYSVINVLSNPFVYHGGQITIKVWTNEYINWWSPIQVATQSPRTTNSTMKEVGILFGIPFETNYPNKCFFKGWILQQNFTSSAIFSEQVGSEEQIIFNLTFPLGDYGVNAFNLINFTLNIHDLYHNLSMANFVDGNVCFYDWNASQFYNFAYGNIENISYGLYYANNTMYINNNNQILCQIVLRGANHVDFHMLLRNLTFSIGYFNVTYTDNYYTTYTITIDGIIRNTLSITNGYTRTDFGYIYTESSYERITFNQTTILATMYRTLTINESFIIDIMIIRRIVYFIEYNSSDFYFNISIISTDIVVYSKGDEDERVTIDGYNIYVYF